MGDWRGLSSGSNWLGGVQHFPPARELSWGPCPLGWFLTQGLGSTGFLQRPLNGGCFFHGSLFNGGVGRSWMDTLTNGCFWLVLQGSLQWGLHCLKWCHQRRRHMAPSLPLAPGCSLPKGVVGPGYTSLPKTGGYAHRPLFSLTAPLWYHGRGTLDPVAGGKPSGRDIWLPGKPGSNSPHHSACSSAGGAQKRPVSYGLAPGSLLLLGSSPAPSTS